METWKDIIGYEGLYQVSNMGNVKSLDRIVSKSNDINVHVKSRILKPSLDRRGYLHLGLYINRKRKDYNIHMLVAKAFITNPDNKLTVNHIDGNKLNNSVTNLEWSTYSEQLKHAYKLNLKTVKRNWTGKFGANHCASKKVIQFDLNDNQIEEYGSIIEASHATKTNHSSIGQACKNNIKSAGGFKWKFKL